MKRQVRWVTLTICGLLCLGSVTAAIAPEDEDAPNVVRPTGVHKRATKSTRQRSSTDSATANDISIPASALNPGPSGAVPNTRANSVMVVDARTGAVLHEKNADQPVRKFSADLKEIHQLAGTCRTFDSEIISVVLVQVHQRPDQKEIHRHPDRTAPV